MSASSDQEPHLNSAAPESVILSIDCDLQMSVCITATNGSAKLFFCASQYIKTYLRLSKKQEYLNSLTISAIDASLYFAILKSHRKTTRLLNVSVFHFKKPANP